MFDSIIKEAQEKFGLGDKAGSLLSSLLGLVANPASGGFGGFIKKFRDAGLGDRADSWISDGENAPLTGEEFESALGAEAVDAVSEQSGVDRTATSTALGFLTPKVVDALTPDGEAPDEAGLLEKVTGFLKEYGGAIGAAVLGGLGTAGALASGAAEKVGGAGKAVVGKSTEIVGDAAGATLDAGKKVAGAVGDTVGGAVGKVGDVFDGDGDSGGFLRILLPLIVVLLLIALGYMLCGPASTPVANAPAANKSAVNTNANITAKVVESSFKIEAKDGKYIVSGVVSDQKTLDEIKAKLDAQFGAGNVDYSGLKVDANAKPFGAGWWDNFQKLLPGLKDWKNGTLAFSGNAITTATGLPAAAIEELKTLFAGWTMPSMSGDAERKLSDVSLPDGTKLQAYPGGIEDQVVKFIQSDEFKNGTADTLKNKWFNFDDLNFKMGTAELATESKRQLDNIVAILKAFPAVKIKIGGYTDKTGNDAANKKLSDERAKAVKAALEKAGVGAQVPEAEGYGEEFATVAETASDEERKIDRKTSIRLLK